MLCQYPNFCAQKKRLREFWSSNITPSILSGSAIQPDSGENLGDTGIRGGTKLNDMIIDLMKLGGQTWQLHLHIMQSIQAENCMES